MLYYSMEPMFDPYSPAKAERRDIIPEQHQAIKFSSTSSPPSFLAFQPSSHVLILIIYDVLDHQHVSLTAATPASVNAILANTTIANARAQSRFQISLLTGMGSWYRTDIESRTTVKAWKHLQCFVAVWITVVMLPSWISRSEPREKSSIKPAVSLHSPPSY